MKRYLAIAGLVGGLLAAPPKAERVYLSESVSEPEAPSVFNWAGPRHFASPMALTVALTDSGTSQFDYWTTIQEPANVNTNDFRSVAWLYRHPSAPVAIRWSWNEGSTWDFMDSLNFKAGLADAGGRYPQAVPRNVNEYPVGTWPELAPGPAWGYMATATADPSNTIGDRTDNIGTHKNIGVYMNDGNVFVAGSDAGQIIYLGVYDPNGGTYIYEPTALLSGVYITGIDYDPFNDVVYFFGSDMSLGPAYWKITWDGTSINIDGPYLFAPIYQMDLGGGYVLDAIISDESALSFDIQTNPVTVKPLYVCELAALNSQADTLSKAIVIANEDTSYPVVVLNPADPNAFLYYPNIVTDFYGNYVIIYNQMTQWDGNLGWGWYDVYKTVCTNHIGNVWSTPVNLTNTSNVNECMVHAPKHFRNDNGSARIWLTYIYDPVNNLDLYFNSWLSAALPHYKDLAYDD
ncbi:MAG: hypothetical protein ABIM88_05315, partial [candidate division WOR-3 bacterium]